MVETVVVGAGPAGSAAAIELARAGREVLLVDRASFPRDKICGDGLTSLALRQLDELGFDPNNVDSWTWTDNCWVRSPSGHMVDFPLPTGAGHHAAIATRLDLDSALVEMARKEGADLAEGCRVTRASEFSDHVELEIEGLGSVRTPHAIAADGMWSPMRKFLGVATEGYLGEWHAFRQYATNVTGRANQDMFVFFEPDILPGYFWSFPLADADGPGRANIGYGVARGGKVPIGEMKALWADLLERPHIREALGEGFELEGSHRAWPIPARVSDLPATTDRTLFVGDAMAACDLMTGEGIGQALLTGRLAAWAILDRGAGSISSSTDSAAAPFQDTPGGVTAAKQYSAAMKADLVADHKMSALLVRAVKHRKGVRTAIRIAGLTPWTRRNFGRWLFEDYPRAMAVTPRRWHRRMFTPKGAYDSV